MSNIKCLLIEEKVFNEVKYLLSTEDLENCNESSECKATQYREYYLGSLKFEDGVEARIYAVSSMSGCWIETQLYKDSIAISEVYQFYGIDEVMEIKLKNDTYLIIIGKENDLVKVSSYCWSGTKENSFD